MSAMALDRIVRTARQDVKKAKEERRKNAEDVGVTLCPILDLVTKDG